MPMEKQFSSADTMASEINVAECIMQHKQGFSAEYVGIANKLADKEVSEDFVISILKQLRGCISEVGQDCDALVSVLMRLEWLKGSKKLADCYQSVVVNLVSAHPVMLHTVLRSLLKRFVPAGVTLKPEEGAGDALTLPEEAALLRVIATINAITKLVPRSMELVVPLLLEHTGHVTNSVRRQLGFTRALLQLASVLPRLRPQLLRVLIDRLVQLDVRAPREAISASIEESESEEEMFKMDDDGIAAVVEPNMNHVIANKLDVLMTVLFSYIKDCCYKEGALDWTATRTLYKELLSIFDTQILSTHNCCHVQFLLFYICSFHQSLAEGFIDYLWKKVQKPGLQVVFRQRAACYLGGMLARAKYLSSETVRVSLELQAQWCHTYVRQCSSAPELALHAPFYTVCQNLFYVFLFHHQQLLDSAKGHKFVMNLNLQGLVTCRMNPLKYCLPAVVKTFASIARQHQIAFCDTIMEHNSRCRIPVALDYSTGSQPKFTQLEPCFPFDPYMLVRSASHIVELYRDFSGQPVLEADRSQAEDTDMDFLESDSETENKERLETNLISPVSEPRDTMDLILHGTSPGFVR